MKNEKLSEFWNDIATIFNQSELDLIEKHTLFLLLEDVVNEIGKYDTDRIKTKQISTRLRDYIDKYFYIFADIAIEEAFILVFQSLFYALDRIIIRQVKAERFEAANNFVKIKNIVEIQKEKWIPNTTI